MGERRLIKKQVEEALHPGRKGLCEHQRGPGSLGAQGWGGVRGGGCEELHLPADGGYLIYVGLGMRWGGEGATGPAKHLFADELFCMHCIRL